MGLFPSYLFALWIHGAFYIVVITTIDVVKYLVYIVIDNATYAAIAIVELTWDHDVNYAYSLTYLDHYARSL